MHDTPLRTALFVPGSRPERFAKALAVGADAVIVDFEDAVEESRKAQARDNLKAFLDAHPQARVLVRVNRAGHPQQAADLAFCAHPGVLGILLPKAEGPEQVLVAAATGKPVWPVVESAQGLAQIPGMARVAGVERLTSGGLDLALDLGLAAGTAAAERMLDQARYALLLHSRLAGLAPPLESIFPRIDDSQGLTRFARDAGDMGFSGMLCIHPKQVAVVHVALAPSEEALHWARQVIAADDGSGAYQVEGQMVDAPVIARAQRVLARAQ